MPRGDRTGPTGQGPRTGRAAGYCSGNAVPGFANPPMGGSSGRGRGNGRGFGRGGGRGWRNIFHATGLTGWQRAAAPPPAPASPPPATDTAPEEQELAILQTRANEISATLAEVQERIAALAAAESQDTTSK